MNWFTNFKRMTYWRKSDFPEYAEKNLIKKKKETEHAWKAF